MAAVGVTVPGLLWLRGGGTSMSGISHPDQIKRQVKAKAQSIPKVMAESMPKGDKVAAVMENPPSTNPQSTTNNPANRAAILSPGSKPTEVDASIENQIEKLADTLPSQPVSPNGT
ncbi:hypothetical protein N0V88_001422 [Collariella sp. IMI 366227]|nr:hypothetical protein N0V88_001422 [Collariella sp. IMI 366227]